MVEPALHEPQYFYPMHSGPFTPEDRARMPEDKRRVELLDGALLVSPAPGMAHNEMVMHLFRLLDRSCPPGVTIYNVPYDYRLPDDSELIPDISVMRREDLGPKRITKPPLLVVEVLSPSSRLIDPLVKRVKYEAAGVPAYWVADPVAPRLTVLELESGRYVERAVLDGGAGEVVLHRPYDVTVHLRLP